RRPSPPPLFPYTTLFRSRLPPSAGTPDARAAGPRLGAASVHTPALSRAPRSGTDLPVPPTDRCPSRVPAGPGGVPPTRPAFCRIPVGTRRAQRRSADGSGAIFSSASDAGLHPTRLAAGQFCPFVGGPPTTSPRHRLCRRSVLPAL